MLVFSTCCYKHVTAELCPEENTDYHVEHPNFPVASATIPEPWQICAEKCSNQSSCNYWTWFKNSPSAGKLRGKCLFKPKRENVMANEWTISGSKYCIEIPGENYILYK